MTARREGRGKRREGEKEGEEMREGKEGEKVQEVPNPELAGIYPNHSQLSMIVALEQANRTTNAT